MTIVTNTPRRPRVGIVGPCTSGKSTLIRRLDLPGVELRHIGQEHSYAPSMWQVIAKPDVLIFLDVSFAESLRRKRLNWNEAEYAEQQRRLAHARSYADLVIDTDGHTPEEVAAQVTAFVRAALDQEPS